MGEISSEEDSITEPIIGEPVEFTEEIPEKQPFLEYNENFSLEYQNWIKNKTNARAVKKPNAGGKSWNKIQKRSSDNSSIEILPNFDERTWMTRLFEIITSFKNRKLTIARLHFHNPTNTPLEKIKLDTLLNFLSNQEE